MISPNHLTKLILTLTGLITVVMGAVLFMHPPAIFPDPGWGFQALRGTQMDGGFNTIVNPDNEDISKNSARFLSWWSPGQYLVPYLFSMLFKVNLGKGTALAVSICSLTGLRGLYFCFKKLGFTPIVSAISIAFIACQLAYIAPYLFYNGGEIILFAFTGWFLYGCIYFKRPGILPIVFLFLSGIIGFFCKSSFLWIYFSGGLYLWISLSSGKKIVTWLTNGVVVALPVILSLAVIYFSYLSKGDNPAAESMGLKFTWETFSFPMAAPLLAGFSIDDIITGGIINHPVIFQLLLALFSVMLIIYLSQTTPYTDYELLLILFYLMCILFFGISFLRQANISYEARHMRVLGLLITPGIIYTIGKLKLPYKLIFGLVWGFILFKGIQSGYTIYQLNKNAAHGTTGLAQIYVDQPTLNYILALDRHERKATFVFISPDLGLEITHNQIITFDRLNDDLKTENDMITYYGHSGPVHILLPKGYMGAKAALYLKSFPGYHNFSISQVGKSYVVYSAK